MDSQRTLNVQGQANFPLKGMLGHDNKITTVYTDMVIWMFVPGQRIVSCGTDMSSRILVRHSVDKTFYQFDVEDQKLKRPVAAHRLQLHRRRRSAPSVFSP